MFQQIFKNSNSSTTKSVLTLLGVIVICLFHTNSVHAASLLLAPSTSKTSVGNIVSMKVVVGTDSKSINNAEGIVQYPTDLLDVISISKGSSIFSLWVEEPRFSNYEGKVTFNGGVPNPGYIGQNGEILSITFKAKKQGNASIVFSDSAVRQNDGLGTDILVSKLPATIQISSASQLETPVVNNLLNSLPVKPVILSSTHPQQEYWYSGNTASFNWTTANDIKSVQTLLNKTPDSTPTVTYDGSVSQRTVNNITDGVLYFHARYMNNVGWGPIANYKIQVDSTPPEKFVVNIRNQDAQDIITLNAVDVTSGIDSYSIKIDNLPTIKVKKDSLVNSEFVLPTQNPGDHNIIVGAYDKAGNHTESSSVYTSLPIESPVITVSPEEIKRSDTIVVSGSTRYPSAKVVIYMQSEGDEIKSSTVNTSSDGSFSITSDELRKVGTVNVWAQTFFLDGIKSPLSNKIHVQVRDELIVETSKSVIYTLSFIIIIILLILGIIFMSYLGWHKFFGLRKRINKEMQSTVNDTHKALMLFKEELDNQLSKLEKIKEDRELNKKEEKIFKELEANVDSIDSFIEKKLKKHF